MRRVGRYVLHEQIAAGGMATVHRGSIDGGDTGATVAIKRLHPHVAAAPGAIEMFMDEARLSARVRHRNIVTTLDIVRDESELFLVMEYVDGVSLAVLARTLKERGERIPLPIASAIVLDVLAGLAAVHDATDDHGQPLSIVHRDVSPQNVLVGVDGVARVLDFGIAKAAVRLQPTTKDTVKGKLHYMAPEQLLDEPVDGRTDQFATAAVLWGMLTGERLFEASSEGAIVAKVLEGVVVAPSKYAAEVPSALDDVVLRALARSRDERFPTCDAMASALRHAVTPAPSEDVGRWVTSVAGDAPPKGTGHVPHVDATITAPLAPEPPIARRRTAAYVAVPVAATAIALGLTALLVSGSGERPIDTATSVSIATVSSLPVAATETTVVPPAPSTSIAASAEPSVADKRPVVVPSKPKKPAPSRACAQMYTVDRDGIRRVKPECL